MVGMHQCGYAIENVHKYNFFLKFLIVRKCLWFDNELDIELKQWSAISPYTVLYVDKKSWSRTWAYNIILLFIKEDSILVLFAVANLLLTWLLIKFSNRCFHKCLIMKSKINSFFKDVMKRYQDNHPGPRSFPGNCPWATTTKKYATRAFPPGQLSWKPTPL